MIADIDKDGSGTIDYDEFQTMMTGAGPCGLAAVVFECGALLAVHPARVGGAGKKNLACRLAPLCVGTAQSAFHRNSSRGAERESVRQPFCPCAGPLSTWGCPSPPILGSIASLPPRTWAE